MNTNDLKIEVEKLRIEVIKAQARYSLAQHFYLMDLAKAPPADFPSDWDITWQPSFEEVTIPKPPAPKYKINKNIMPPRAKKQRGAK
jgi:hypothetical protein